MPVKYNFSFSCQDTKVTYKLTNNKFYEKINFREPGIKEKSIDYAVCTGDGK